MGHVVEYSHALHALNPFSLCPPTAPLSIKIILALKTSPKVNDFFFPFNMEDFELYQDLKFSSTHSNWHLVIVPFNYWSFSMVFEHLHDCFHLKDFVNGFFQLF